MAEGASADRVAIASGEQLIKLANVVAKGRETTLRSDEGVGAGICIKSATIDVRVRA